MNSNFATWRNEERTVAYDSYKVVFYATYWSGYGKAKIYFNSGTKLKNGRWSGTCLVFDVIENKFEGRPYVFLAEGIKEAFGLQ